MKVSCVQLDFFEKNPFINHRKTIQALTSVALVAIGSVSVAFTLLGSFSGLTFTVLPVAIGTLFIALGVLGLVKTYQKRRREQDLIQNNDGALAVIEQYGKKHLPSFLRQQNISSEKIDFELKIPIIGEKGITSDDKEYDKRYNIKLFRKKLLESELQGFIHPVFIQDMVGRTKIKNVFINEKKVDLQSNKCLSAGQSILEALFESLGYSKDQEIAKNIKDQVYQLTALLNQNTAALLVNYNWAYACHVNEENLFPHPQNNDYLEKVFITLSEDKTKILKVCLEKQTLFASDYIKLNPKICYHSFITVDLEKNIQRLSFKKI